MKQINEKNHVTSDAGMDGVKMALRCAAACVYIGLFYCFNVAISCSYLNVVSNGCLTCLNVLKFDGCCPGWTSFNLYSGLNGHRCHVLGRDFL